MSTILHGASRLLKPKLKILRGLQELVKWSERFGIIPQI